MTSEGQFWSHFDDRGNTWRDGGPATHLFPSLTAGERERTEQRLLAMLADPRNRDEWVAMALGDLGAMAAVAGIRQRLATSRGRYRVAAAEALWKLTREPDAVSEIIQILYPRGWLSRLYVRLGGDTFERISAVVALGGIDTPESRAVVQRALGDANFLIRANARTSDVRQRTGLTDMMDILRAQGYTFSRNDDGSESMHPPSGG